MMNNEEPAIIRTLKENPRLLHFYIKTDEILKNLTSGKDVSIDLFLTAYQFLGAFVQTVNEQEGPNDFKIIYNKEELEKIKNTLR